MKPHRMNRSVRWLLTTWLLLAVILTLTGPVSVARAASFVVSNLSDSGTGSLRQAISDANASAGADTITFSISGTILLSSTLPAITGAAGLTIDGAGQSITISGNDAVRVMFVELGAALALRDLTIADGNANSSVISPGSGGGIYNAGTLTVADCTFSGNSVTYDGGIYMYWGGAIFNDGTLEVTGSIFSGNDAIAGAGIFSRGTLDVTGSTFSGNTAYEGGGITSWGALTVTDSTFSGNDATSGGGIDGGGQNSTATVTGSAFSGNTASSQGGGILNNGGTLEVSDSTFSGNFAGSGGGILNGGFATHGTLHVSHSTFSNNHTGVSGGGGGINSWGPLTVTDSTFSGNSAHYFGGGGISTDNETASVTNSTFSNNSADDSVVGGGGIYNNRALTVTNSTFSGNSATLGGAIANAGVVYESGGPLTVINSTFSGNSAPSKGGGIYNHSIATLQNTLVADSTGGNCFNDASLTDGGGNLSWPDTTCPGLNADPLLGPLQDNGGPTQTHALLPGSPAIDAALLKNCPSTDQRGISRPQGAGCDIGAYESVVYNFSGFFQPVDNLPIFNIVQAGVGVPVRFSLNGDQGLNIFAAGYPDSQQIVCKSGAPQDAIEETVIVSASSLSYDAASDTYTYVWKTNKAWANTCRQLNVKLNDGAEHKANFKFVR